MINSNKRKLCLSGWLKNNYHSSYKSPVKLHFLLFYESFSKINGEKADFTYLKGYNVFLSSFSLTFFVLCISLFLNMFKNILSFKEESIFFTNKNIHAHYLLQEYKLHPRTLDFSKMLLMLRLIFQLRQCYRCNKKLCHYW